MNIAVSSFLANNPPQTEEDAAWGEGGSLKMRLTSHLCQELPPLDLITSVRAIVLRGPHEILVVDEPDGATHILPGGRREQGETLIQTLRREVLEETGWALKGDVALLGCKHFHILVPKPEGFSYVYPDFFQPVYLAYADQHQPEAMQYDEYVLGSHFEPLSAVRKLSLTQGERLFLETLVQAGKIQA